MQSFMKIVVEGGVPIWAILALGGFGLLVIFDRIKTYYFQYNIDARQFVETVRGYIKADQLEEAINYAAAHEKAPIAHVAKSVLIRANRDDDSIQQALDISLSETIPRVGKRLAYLSMVSNVATLIGLLGTIQGLIMSFEAVSFADPAQKQTLLSQGISQSMNTTAFGLAVAIPVMVVYSFLHAKQGSILEELTEYSAKIVDVLAMRNYRGFVKEGVYPDSVNEDSLQSNGPSAPPKPKAS